MTKSITPHCWNCGAPSPIWMETVSTEKCNACGIACYYHGSGANDAYNEAHDRKNAEADRKSKEEFDKWYGDG